MMRQALPQQVRERLLATLESSPRVRGQLLQQIAADSPLWDFRSDPRRFSLREIVAHLADCEEVWLERLVRTREDEKPVLTGFDADAMATCNDYAHSDPARCIERLQKNRTLLVGLLRSLTDEDWARVGVNPVLGPMTIETQAVQIACHDGYHAGQIAELLNHSKERHNASVPHIPLPRAVGANEPMPTRLYK